MYAASLLMTDMVTHCLLYCDVANSSAPVPDHVVEIRDPGYHVVINHGRMDRTL